ncbi:MAG: pyrroline-5-carboxylate reductase [Cellulosilyticaceae bacterium]
MIGFIGIGNMGGAMAKSIAQMVDTKVFIYDVNKEMYSKFEEAKIVKCETLKELIESVKYVVLSIKPQYYLEVCERIKDFLEDGQVVVTVAPGYSIKDMKEILGEKVKIVRTMPNTPALIGKGVTAYCYDKRDLEEQEVEDLLRLFKSFGHTFKVEEGQMEAVIATSGSSPAYGYMFIEAMADAAVSFGMPRSMAYEMAALSIKGACEMILETKKHPGVLKDEVTSPGGTTIQAVAKLEETGFRHSVISGMTACYDKAKDMSKI